MAASELVLSLNKYLTYNENSLPVDVLILALILVDVGTLCSGATRT